MPRRLLKSRFLLPSALLMTVGLGSVLGLSAAAAQTKTAAQSARISHTGQPPSTTAGASHGGSRVTPPGTTRTQTPTQTPTAAGGKKCEKELTRISYTSPKNSGSPKTSDNHTCSNGRVTSYGSKAINYKSPPRSYVAAGEAIFEQVCSSCHGTRAQGTALAPALKGVGSGVVDFWVTTGRMPAATPLTVQAVSKPTKLSNLQADQIAAWVTSLTAAPPFVPYVNVKSANLATGASLFALNCAGCHTITGAGDELAAGTFAPSLHSVNTTQIAEAIRSGPGNMPRFTGNLSDAQVADIVAYVHDKLQHPTNAGGFGLGGVGPVPEGFVALLFGVGILMLVCFWIGDRSAPPAEEEVSGDHH